MTLNPLRRLRLLESEVAELRKQVRALQITQVPFAQAIQTAQRPTVSRGTRLEPGETVVAGPGTIPWL